MPLAWLALLVAVLPFAVVQLCYAVSVLAGLIPGCIPYLTGCTSISAAGRHGASYFIFKGGMIPSAVLLALYWILCRRWLLALGARDSAAVRSMVEIGIVSGAFLALYAVYLGSKGDFYNFMRRFGVTVHLSFALLAQILLIREITRLPERAHARVPRGVRRGKLAVVGALLGLGLLSIPVGNFMPDKDRAQNVIEWTFATLMLGYYAFTWRAWQATGFRAEFGVR